MQFADRAINLLAESHPVELVQHRLVEALDDPVRLRTLGLGPGMVDILHRQVELVFVVLGVAAIFGAAIGQHPAELHLLGIVERHHPIIEQVGGGDRRLAVIELGEGDLRIGVDEGLLIDTPDTLHVADVKGVLRAAIAGALAFELAMRLLLGFGLLERRELALGEHQPFLGDLGLERLEPLLHRLQIVALPHPAHAGRRDRMTALAHLVGDADLAEGGLFERQVDDDRLDLRRRAVGHQRLAARQLLQGKLPAGLVEFLEAVEAVARVAHHLAGLADVAKLLGELQEPHLGANDLLVLGHGRCP